MGMGVRVWLGLGLLLAGGAAQADIYKCADDQGRVTYTNSKLAKGCTLLNRDQPVSSVPSPGGGRPSPAEAATFPKVSDEAQRNRDSDRKRILTQELATEEKALDEAKKALASEEDRDAPEDRNIMRKRADGSSYASLNPEKRADRLQPFKDKIELHQRNVDALKRELAGLK
jgi:hypothetical protein